MCREPVSDETCADLAERLLAEGGSSTLALELLMDLRSRGQARLDGEVLDDEIIEAIRKAAKTGDASKIPAIAVFLGKGPGSGNKPLQSPEVRVVALEALRALVPAFSSSWVALPEVLKLLRDQCLEDRNKDVRIASLRCLREVSPKGAEIDTFTVRRVLEDKTSDSDVREEAIETLRILSDKDDKRSTRTAFAALLDKDPGVRCTAFSTLKSVCTKGSPESAALLGDLARLIASHHESEVRCLALELIGHAEVEGGPLGTAVAVRSLLDPVEEVHLQAMATLKRLWSRGDAEAVTVLSRIAVKGNDSVERSLLRMEAMRHLPRVAVKHNAEACNAAVIGLSDVDSGVRVEAAGALKQVCQRGDEGVCNRLLCYLSHKDLEVQRLAIETLGGVGSRQDAVVTTMLKKLINSDDVDLQLMAESAMRQLQ